MSQSLARNAFFNLSYKALSIVFPLITVTYASHKLLSKGIGQVSYAQSIVAYFVVVASLGIPYYGVREIAKSKNRKELDITFSNIFLINALITTFCIFAYYSLIWNAPMFHGQRTLLCIVGIILILNYINVDWFYQGEEEYVYIAMRSLIVKVIFTILLFLVIKGPQDYIKYALLYYLAFAGNYIFNFIHLRKFVKFDFSKIEIKKHIRPIFILFAGIASVEIYMQLGVTLLGYYAEKECVGYYSNSNHIMRVVANSLMAIGAVILPRVSKYYMENRIEEIKDIVSKLICLLLFMSLPCAILLFFLANYLVPLLFGYSFIPAIKTLEIFSPLIVILTIMGGVTTPILMSTNQEKRYFLSSMVAVLLNICLIIPLLKYLHNGIACASVLTEGCLLLIQLRYIKLFLNIRTISVNLLKTILSCLLMTGVLYCSESYFRYNSYLTMSLMILFGSTTFLLVSHLLSDSSYIFLRGKMFLLFQKIKAH